MKELQRHSENLDKTTLLIGIIGLMLIFTSAGTGLIVGSKGSGLARHGGVGGFQQQVDIETFFPDRFADWNRIPLAAAVLPAESVMGPGEAVAYRAYRNRLGRIITLVVAYGPPASDSVRLHRPETCYAAQGYLIDWRKNNTLMYNEIAVPLKRLMASNSTRHEAVTYWLRAGDDYAVSAAAHQWINLQQGLGKTAEGVLVRVSSAGRNDAEFDLHAEFIDALLTEMQDDHRSVLIVR